MFVCAQDGYVTWKESLAGERGAMGLSVLQKWMVEGRGLGVSRTGVWRQEERHIKGSEGQAEGNTDRHKPKQVLR